MNGPVIGVAATVAVSALVLTGLAVRRVRPARIDGPDAAARVAEAAIGGFSAIGAVVGADGNGALAVGRDHRVAAIAPAGRQVVAREVRWAAVRAGAQGVVIETGDRRLGRIMLVGVDVLDIRRLAGAGSPLGRGA